tara:strand:+ start:2565 stop:2738 length:174 start_codon:yes stop_codon:yes gene_type:complete
VITFFVEMKKEKQPPENSTLVQRIEFYVNTNQIVKAKALATVGDTLEEAYSWDTEFI